MSAAVQYRVASLIAPMAMGSNRAPAVWYCGSLPTTEATVR